MVVDDVGIWREGVVSCVGMLGPQLAKAVFGWDPGAQLKTEELGWGGRPAGRRQSPRQRGERVSGTWL